MSQTLIGVPYSVQFTYGKVRLRRTDGCIVEWTVVQSCFAERNGVGHDHVAKGAAKAKGQGGQGSEARHAGRCLGRLDLRYLKDGVDSSPARGVLLLKSSCC